MKILFICTGNTCRSPMAEGIFNKMVQDKKINDIFCQSAGLSTTGGLSVSKNAVAVCKEIGVDISTHCSRRITTQDAKTFDLLAVMTAAHAYVLQTAGVPQGKIYVLGDQIQDPYGGDLGIYRMCRDQISAALDQLLLLIQKGSSKAEG